MESSSIQTNEDFNLKLRRAEQARACFELGISSPKVSLNITPEYRDKVIFIVNRNHPEVNIAEINLQTDSLQIVGDIIEIQNGYIIIQTLGHNTIKIPREVFTKLLTNNAEETIEDSTENTYQWIEDAIETAFTLSPEIAEKKTEDLTPLELKQLEKVQEANIQFHLKLFNNSAKDSIDGITGENRLTEYFSTVRQSILEKVASLKAEVQVVGELPEGKVKYNLSIFSRTETIIGKDGEPTKVEFIDPVEREYIQKILGLQYSDENFLRLNAEEVNKVIADMEAKLGEERSLAIQKHIGILNQYYFGVLFNQIDTEKKEQVWEYTRERIYNKELREKSLVVGKGDTGAGKGTFFGQFHYPFIVHGTGTGYISKEQEGWYRIFTKTMAGYKLATNAGMFNKFIDMVSPVTAIAIRGILDNNEYTDVPIFTDGSIRSEVQLNDFSSGHLEEVIAYNFGFQNVDLAAGRIISRLVQSILESTDRIEEILSGKLKQGDPDFEEVMSEAKKSLRQDDYGDLKIDGKDATKESVINLIIEGYKSLEERVFNGKNFINLTREEKQDKLAQQINGLWYQSISDTKKEGARIDINQSGRFFRYHKLFAEFAAKLRANGVNDPAVFTDYMSRSTVTDAFLRILGPDIFPQDQLQAILEKRKRDRDSINTKIVRVVESAVVNKNTLSPLEYYKLFQSTKSRNKMSDRAGEPHRMYDSYVLNGGTQRVIVNEPDAHFDDDIVSGFVNRIRPLGYEGNINNYVCYISPQEQRYVGIMSGYTVKPDGTKTLQLNYYDHISQRFMHIDIPVSEDTHNLIPLDYANTKELDSETVPFLRQMLAMEKSIWEYEVPLEAVEA